VQFSALATFIAYSIERLLSTGIVPGSPKQTGQTWVLGHHSGNRLNSRRRVALCIELAVDFEADDHLSRFPSGTPLFIGIRDIDHAFVFPWPAHNLKPDRHAVCCSAGNRDGRDAGKVDRDGEDVREIHREGSVFSPRLNAIVGMVGPAITSTSAKMRAKSCFTFIRATCALA